MSATSFAPDRIDATIWSLIDRGVAAPLDAPPEDSPGETFKQVADAGAAKRWIELCLDHVLIREVIQEAAAQAEAAEGTTAQGKAAAGPSDAVLVMQAEQGIPGAFNVLVERYFSQIFGVAYSQLRDREAAMDVAQDAFLEAAQKLTSLRVREKFGHWVYGIARRKAIYVLRRRKMHRAAVEVKKEEEKTLPRPDAPGAPMEREERNEQIRDLLNQLPEIYREIIVLKYIDDRSYDEIATLLGISKAAVDKRLMRGKEMLRESLRRWLGE